MKRETQDPQYLRVFEKLIKCQSDWFSVKKLSEYKMLNVCYGSSSTILIDFYKLGIVKRMKQYVKRKRGIKQDGKTIYIGRTIWIYGIKKPNLSLWPEYPLFPFWRYQELKKLNITIEETERHHILRNATHKTGEFKHGYELLFRKNKVYLVQHGEKFEKYNGKVSRNKMMCEIYTGELDSEGMLKREVII